MAVLSATKECPMKRLHVTQNLAKQAATAGANYLDRTFGGTQWAGRVDLSQMNVGDCCNCPIYFATGEDYNTAVIRMGIQNPATLGFYKSRCVPYRALTRAWIPLVRDRQTAARRVQELLAA
jgi:hypothetical protein